MQSGMTTRAVAFAGYLTGCSATDLEGTHDPSELDELDDELEVRGSSDPEIATVAPAPSSLAQCRALEDGCTEGAHERAVVELLARRGAVQTRGVFPVATRYVVGVAGTDRCRQLYLPGGSVEGMSLDVCGIGSPQCSALFAGTAIEIDMVCHDGHWTTGCIAEH
jgi:hypothetical protein